MIRLPCIAIQLLCAFFICSSGIISAFQNIRISRVPYHTSRYSIVSGIPAQQNSSYDDDGDDGDDDKSQQQSQTQKRPIIGRDKFLSFFVKAPTAAAIAATAAITTTRQALAAEEEPAPQENGKVEGITMYKTESGLKYLELQEGTGPSPRYGQLCAIQYTGYMKLPNDPKPKQFDSNSFLIKHGNGRIIPGLDEGLHTMQVGGKRRLIIPPKLGYVESGLGPIPELPWNRWSLNNLLDQMIEQQGGNLVFEVELKSVISDEADQGYYEDTSPSPEEFERLKLNFQERSAAAAVAREAAENSTI